MINKLPFPQFWIIIAGIIVLPFITSSSYILMVMVFVALHGTLAIGMGILLEHAGIFSLAHPTWFGLGAYTAGILSTKQIVSPPVGIIFGAGFVALISYLIGAPILRLRGYYLACATFALLLIVEMSLGQLGSITGGHEGLSGIPTLSVGGFAFKTDIQFYSLSWALCLGCLWFLSNLLNSRIGRAIRSFRDSEIASRSMGVDVPKFKLQIFVLTSVMASIAGSIFCFYIRFTMPGMFGFPLLVELLTMIVIGGGKGLYGPLLGSFITIWFKEFIHLYLGKILPVMKAEADAIFFGILIILILIFMPHGFAGEFDRLFYSWRKRFDRLQRTGN
ncbi:MAG: branched-chain amino acid ABC transporter permease [Thermodesulfobacteriota bacterium]